jgi:hypothetical protein
MEWAADGHSFVTPVQAGVQESRGENGLGTQTRCLALENPSRFRGSDVCGSLSAGRLDAPFPLAWE